MKRIPPSFLKLVLAVVIWLGIQSSASAQANLVPFRPSGWDAPIVVSNLKGTTLDALTITATDRLYVDAAVLNSGNASVSASFSIQFYLDGVLLGTGNVPPPLDVNYYVYYSDIPLEPLSAGSHTIRMVIDSGNTIAESSETDNEYTKTFTVSAGPPIPNLTPYTRNGWSDKIIVSSVSGTNVDSSPLTSTDALYVDLSFINNGTGEITTAFQVKLYVDDQEKATFPINPPLGPNVVLSKEDYALGSLAEGSHIFKIVVDASGAVTESNESDNEYRKTFTVVRGTCHSLIVNVVPSDGGTVTRSQPPNCSASGLTLSENQISAGPDGSELERIALAKFERSESTIRNVETLAAKARANGTVRVIVGLRAGSSALGRLTGEESEAALTARGRAVAQLQDEFLARPALKEARAVKKFKLSPALALDVDLSGLEKLEADPDVASIDEDMLMRPFLAESVALIGAPAAWASGFSGTGQTVAILDSGVDKSHPFLAGKITSEACYSTTSSTPSSTSVCPGGVGASTAAGSGVPCQLDGCEHGTHVAGIAAGKGTSFSGVAKDANIISIQVTSQVNDPLICGEANAPCSLTRASDQILGLERVLELSTSMRIAAVNLSLGVGKFPSSCDSLLPSYKAAIDALRSRGIATIIASGNDEYSDGLSFPACISSAISVGSVDDGSNETAKDAVSFFSNSSSLLNLLAPGMWIRSSVPGGEFKTFAGTSMAAPHVAGAWAVFKSRFFNASVPQVLSAFTATGQPVSDLRNGLIKPRLRLDAALSGAGLGEQYTFGTSLTLTPVAKFGYQFKNWIGCDTVVASNCVVTMNLSKGVTANFEPVGPSGIDLTQSSFTGSSTAVAGGPISLSAEVRNQGTVDAGSFRQGIYLSTDSSISTSDTLIGFCRFETGLRAGASSTCSGVVDLPSSLAAGSYFLGAIVDDQSAVAESNETNNSLQGGSVVVRATVSSTLFVPIILSAAGLNGSFFTSELMLTNRGSQTALLQYKYTEAFGGGSGSGIDILGAGKQRILPDAITYLRSVGVPIPESGNRGGTLLINAAGLTTTSDVGVTVRTTTKVDGGQAGLAYSAVPAGTALTGPVYLCGLRQNQADRSNVAIQNVGSQGAGNITLRLTVISGDTLNPKTQVLPEEVLAPGEFRQISGILVSNGLSLTNGYVRVERISGTAPYYAYAVLNDQFNSDGSFVPPIPEALMTGKTKLTLPVAVEANTFSTELIVTNWSSSKKTLSCRYTAPGIQTSDSSATFTLEINSSQQLILADFVQFLRSLGTPGIGLPGPALAGALFVESSGDDLSGISVSARTSAPGGGGRYGLFYNSVPSGLASTSTAWIYGLQQNTLNRSNLAMVNTGEVDTSPISLAVDLFDGLTGAKVASFTVTLSAREWKQIGTVLAQYAPDTPQGYARITLLSGNNPFLAYAVINDGGQPGERTGDGAFIPAQP